uniref:Uncharacterized protein n=1 Tax=Daphnia magna TaxID=35525 RepID=A0A0P6ISH5_9CRUS
MRAPSFQTGRNDKNFKFGLSVDRIHLRMMARCEQQMSDKNSEADNLLDHKISLKFLAEHAEY